MAIKEEIKKKLQEIKRHTWIAFDEAETFFDKVLTFYEIHKGPLWAAFMVGFTIAYLLAATFGTAS